MCYVIAKKFNEHGCIALEAKAGSTLASMVDYLSRRKFDSDVQIVTISSKEAFKEYAPYKDIKSEGDFISKVLAM